jgi:hypothetical protein
VSALRAEPMSPAVIHLATFNGDIAGSRRGRGMERSDDGSGDDRDGKWRAYDGICTVESGVISCESAEAFLVAQVKFRLE